MKLSHLLVMGLFCVSSGALSQIDSNSDAPQQPLEAAMIIDRIELTGDAKISAGELAKSLEIPIGTQISNGAVSDLLNDIERRLKASGKYRDNLSIKLVKGRQYPHFILKIDLSELNDWYIGADGHFLQSPRYPSFERSPVQTGDLDLYVGNRDYNSDGLALDLDFFSSLTELRIKENFYDGKFAFSLNGLTGSIIQRRQHFYFGAISRLFHVSNWNSFVSDSSYTYENKTYRVVASSAATVKSFSTSLEPIAGVRFGKFQLGGKFSRSSSRKWRSRENGDYAQYINGIPDPTFQYWSSDSADEDDKYTFNNNAEITVIWSDKSKLTFIEPGLDLRATWSRTYYTGNSGTDAPNFLAHIEYSFLFADRISASAIADGNWEFSKYSSNYQTSVKRRFDIGTRLDYVSLKELVLFGGFYRIGGKRNELSPTSPESGYELENRFDAGVKYASSDMIYSLSLTYGPPLAGENYFANSTDSVYKRLGVK